MRSTLAIGIEIDSDKVRVKLDGSTLARSSSGLKVADDGIDSAQLADNAVRTENIQADAVTGAKIPDNAIDSEHIATGAVTQGKIASNAVASGKLATGAVTTAKIGDSQVTKAKLANDAKVTANPTGTDGNDLTRLNVGGTNYSIPSTSFDLHDDVTTRVSTTAATGVLVDNAVAIGYEMKSTGMTGTFFIPGTLHAMKEYTKANPDIFVRNVSGNIQIKGEAFDANTFKMAVICNGVNLVKIYSANSGCIHGHI